MKLENLTGNHKLSGVELSTVKKYRGSTDCIAFILDNITYLAIENSGDGYRSYLDDLEITENPISNTFTPIDVFCKMSSNEGDDVLEMYDIKTTLLVLRMGTENTDDYYPYCKFEYLPENMILNKEVTK